MWGCATIQSQNKNALQIKFTRFKKFPHRSIKIIYHKAHQLLFLLAQLSTSDAFCRRLPQCDLYHFGENIFTKNKLLIIARNFHSSLCSPSMLSVKSRSLIWPNKSCTTRFLASFPDARGEIKTSRFSLQQQRSKSLARKNAPTLVSWCRRFLMVGSFS